MKTPKHIVIYSRVSTDKQSTASQLTELREYCQRRGWPEAEVIEDTISGRKAKRPGLDEVMARVRRGRVDVVLAFKLDRLARSLSHLVQMTEEFARHGVALIVPSQGLDTSSDSPAGKLQLQVLAAVGEFERSLIVERVNAGLAVARAKGVKLGRKRKLDAHRPRVAELVAEGKSARKIAEELGIPLGSVFLLCKEAKNAQAAG
jgi:DNA invertase Pin-like site-specific DNA recombinase